MATQQRANALYPHLRDALASFRPPPTAIPFILSINTKADYRHRRRRRQ